MAKSPRTPLPPASGPAELNADALTAAQSRIAYLENRLGEERLAWSTCLLVTVDIILLPNIKHLIDALFMLMFQVLLLLLLARLFGAVEVATMLEQLLRRIRDKTGTGT